VRQRALGHLRGLRRREHARGHVLRQVRGPPLETPAVTLLEHGEACETFQQLGATPSLERAGGPVHAEIPA
jgi:hypothetical protein